VVVNEEVDVLV